MNIDFKTKTILVTGGTNGIGASIAAQFSRNGGTVYITGTSDKSLATFKESFPDVEAKFLMADFSDLNQLKAFLIEVEKIPFDILINNAGINKINTIDDIELEEWQRIQDINIRAPFMISQVVVKSMRKKKYGRIINIASVFGVVTKEKRLSYTTSKAALIGMTRTMALDLANDNILVNAISPGFIDTELTRKVLGPEGIKEMVAKVPLQKLGTSDDVAGLTLFLSSDLNGFMTGQNIILDGGFTCA
jgi:3-oxoacyl-[acyl-carrier protein] reductase